MCSMTWHHHPGGYEVFFNRDEKKTRRRAVPPSVQHCRRVRYLAPRDSDAGGTWLLANEHGVLLALLNLWESNQVSAEPRLSRGRLLSDELADAGDAATALERTRSLDLRSYPGFTLAAFDTRQPNGPLLLRWDGQQLSSPPALMPVCSSSFQPDAVLRARRELFLNASPITTPELWRWHTSEPHPTAFTVRMNRPDAQTWSISHVQVSDQAIHWRYREEMPDLLAEAVEHTIILER